MRYAVLGKTAFVTGATSGIGLACAQQLAGLGARVAICGRRSELLAEIARELGADAIPIVADVS